MRRKLMLVVVVGGVCAGAVAYVGNVMATPASGFTSTSLAIGRLAEFHVMHKLVWDDPDPTNSRKHVGAIQRAFGWQSASEGLFRASSGCGVFAVREGSTTPSRLLTKSTSYAEAGNGSRSPMQLALLK